MLNIFILHPSMKYSAQYTYDMHLNKEILEICQILCLVRRSKGLSFLKSYVPRRHINNPIVKWVAASYFNYVYVFSYMRFLEKEFMYRYSRERHKTVYDYMNLIADDNEFKIMHLFSRYDLMSPIAYMRPEFIVKNNNIVDVVNSYRAYYFYYKSHTLPRVGWKNRSIPYWHNESYFKSCNVSIDFDIKSIQK